jgi:hypothetical protein
MTKRSKKESIVVLSKSAEEAAAIAEQAKAVGFEVVPREIKFRPEQVIIRWARDKGDWDTLADYILGGNRITNEMREFLWAVLRRKVRKPNNRSPSFATVFGEGGLIHRVKFFLSLLDRGIARDRAITETAETFHVDRRTIQRNLEEAEDTVKLLMLYSRAAADHRYRCRYATTRYAVSPTALSQHFMS